MSLIKKPLKKIKVISPEEAREIVSNFNYDGLTNISYLPENGMFGPESSIRSAIIYLDKFFRSYEYGPMSESRHVYRRGLFGGECNEIYFANFEIHEGTKRLSSRISIFYEFPAYMQS